MDAMGWCLSIAMFFFGDYIWMFPKIGVPQNEWFILKNPIKMDDLGVPLFSETSISLYHFQLFFKSRPSWLELGFIDRSFCWRMLGKPTFIRDSFFRSYFRIWFLYSQVQIILADVYINKNICTR